MTIGGKPAEDWGEDSAPDNNDVFATADSRHDAWALLDQDYGDEVDRSVEERLPRKSQSGDKIPALLLVIVALAWIGGVSWKIFGSDPGMTAEFITTLNLIALASGPAAVLAIAYLLVGPTSRRETRRYGRTAQAMRVEASRLDEVLAALVERIEANSVAMREQISLLEGKGTETAQPIAEINDSMRENITTLACHSLLRVLKGGAELEERLDLIGLVASEQIDQPGAASRAPQLAELRGKLAIPCLPCLSNQLLPSLDEGIG